MEQAKTDNPSAKSARNGSPSETSSVDSLKARKKCENSKEFINWKKKNNKKLDMI